MSAAQQKRNKDLAERLERVTTERDRMRTIIIAWCKEHKWCASAWKNEPTNMALFNEAGQEVEPFTS